MTENKAQTAFLSAPQAAQAAGGKTKDSVKAAEDRVILAARAGPNAAVLREVLEMQAIVCMGEPTVEAVSDAIASQASLVVLTEEVLTDKELAKQLGDRLSQQPDWSDIPIIILLSECQRFKDCLALLGKTTHHRSVMLLELPLKRPIFAALVRSCLRNRARQYALRDTLHQLKESNEILENFSHTVAHELRNPLGVVTSSLDLIERTDLTPKQEKLVAMGRRTARGMNQTVGALLDYGKLRSHTAEDFAAVDMNTVVTESTVVLQSLIQKNASDNKPVNITWQNLPTVYGSRQLLIQLTSNLIKNAIVHNDAEAPTIIVTAKKQSSSNTQNSRWLITVTDNGPGIPSSAQASIFKMFNRAGKTRTEGSGIGLALCQRVIEQHQGSLGVQSTVGQGSAFYFDLPAAVSDQN